LQECLRNIHRIVEIRLNDKFGVEPIIGNLVWDWHEALAAYTDPGYAEKGQLTVTYLTDAHRACAAQIKIQMLECGFDDVRIDAVGNVVGRYLASEPSAKTLLTGSHYDTVRNGGKYDGRLGIFVPMACVRELKRLGKRLPFHFEVVGFAEEEGQRYKATFLGSGALVGQFDSRWLDQKDADGISMREAMAHAGLNIDDIAGADTRSVRVSRLCRSAYRTGSGSERAGCTAGRGHIHQRQRTLRCGGYRHRLPRRHHPDGPAQRRGGGSSGSHSCG
jgi:N-carbamoyl-L-amino-acid hydrolase